MDGGVACRGEGRGWGRGLFAFFALFASFAFLLALSATDIHAQTSWTKYSGNPVLPNGPSGAWDEARAYFGWVIFDNGTYKVWYNGFNNAGTHAIGYATSANGITWTKHPGNPVLSPTEAWEGAGIIVPTVIKDGGIYRMWYAGVSSVQAIGYATSTDGISWTKHTGNPVMTPTSGQWDAGSVRPGTVILESGTFKMWYGGGGGIGYATSANGITWAKHPGNPVLSGDNDLPSVLKVGTNYHMWRHHSRKVRRNLLRKIRVA